MTIDQHVVIWVVGGLVTAIFTLWNLYQGAQKESLQGQLNDLKLQVADQQRQLNRIALEYLTKAEFAAMRNELLQAIKELGSKVDRAVERWNNGQPS